MGSLALAMSALDEGFELGADLEFGAAVHDLPAGPPAAWTLAAILLVVALLGLFDTARAGRWLRWSSFAVPVVTALYLAALALFDNSTFKDVGLTSVPFVIAFYTVPAFLISIAFGLSMQTQRRE
jgi:hypothetical protein